MEQEINSDFIDDVDDVDDMDDMDDVDIDINIAENTKLKLEVYVDDEDDELYINIPIIKKIDIDVYITEDTNVFVKKNAKEYIHVFLDKKDIEAPKQKFAHNEVSDDDEKNEDENENLNRYVLVEKHLVSIEEDIVSPDYDDIDDEEYDDECEKTKVRIHAFKSNNNRLCLIIYSNRTLDIYLEKRRSYDKNNMSAREYREAANERKNNKYKVKKFCKLWLTACVFKPEYIMAIAQANFQFYSLYDILCYIYIGDHFCDSYFINRKNTSLRTLCKLISEEHINDEYFHGTEDDDIDKDIKDPGLNHFKKFQVQATRKLTKFFNFIFESNSGFKKLKKDINNEFNMGNLSQNAFFVKEEGYKHNVYQNARKVLDFINWQSSDIGNGKIAERAIKAVDVAENLVHHQQKIHFKNKILSNTKKAEQLLYNIYCTDNDAESFEDAVIFLGGKYDLLAYLFFIKDDEKYLPINSKNFDERFYLLGIPFRTSRSCSSENYFLFVEYINKLRTHMEKYYGCDISLLDAHSVIWQISLANDYVTKCEEDNADALLTKEVNEEISLSILQATGYIGTPQKRRAPICLNGRKTYPRNKMVSLNALCIANHSCELDSSHQSFIRKNSNLKYMEPHHLVPMANSGDFDVCLDVEENIVCLCSNCHNEIHYGKYAKEKVAILYEKRKALLERAGIYITLEELMDIYK